uniref:PIPK domain-containing protein n=1 Tax=Globodera pallida TaxID=36090 RepID=A0A183CKZ9_GLOPA
MISLPKALISAFILKFIIQFSVADPKNQLGFAYTSVSNAQNYGDDVDGDILQFIVIGDIGGEEYETNSTVVEGTVADSTVVKGTVKASTTVNGTVKASTMVKHRPTQTQKAVADAIDELSKEKGKVNFLLNTGDNFYENGVTFADVIPRFTENFEKVYKHQSLNVPWYTIAGNNDWESTDGIRPQIEMLEGKWTFPAQQYVVHYTFGKVEDQFGNRVQERRSVRIIMIDTTVLCGTASTNAKKHFTWLRKELREAKRRRVNFLFVVGHIPLHILDKERGYPCAARVHALMRYYQVQAYFAGHTHSLQYADLSEAGQTNLGIDSIDTKFIVSGAGSRMENAILESRFPKAYLKFMKFVYPTNVGIVSKVKGETTHSRGAFDGGAFVGVEINAKEMLAKLNFYAAGMFYNKDGTKKPIEKWHKFEGQEIQMKPRRIDKTDENVDICNEFLELGPQLVDDDHFKMDDTERIQSILGTYFFYAGEAFDALREKLGINYRKLAESFLSGDLVSLNSLGKSSKYELDTLMKTLPNYVDHLFKMGEKSFLSRIYLVFRINTEDKPNHFILMNNVFENAKDVPLLTFDVKGVFSHQRAIVKVTEDQRLNDVVLKWYNFFGGTKELLPDKMEAMFKNSILLDKATHKNIAERLKKDFEILAKNDVNDWSIIFGVHFVGNEKHKISVGESSVDCILPYFRGRCNQCRNHPDPASPLLNNQTLRLYIGIVDFFTPFSEARKERYMEGLKKFIKNVNSNHLMDYVKAGSVWETFGAIPPEMYGHRMLAFSMVCAFRWWQKEEALDAPEAIRQALIQAFCDSYGKNLDKSEEESILAMLDDKSKDWKNELQRDTYLFKNHTVTIFGVPLFKRLMEKWEKYFWNFLNQLAEDELKKEKETFVQKNRAFVVRKLSKNDVKNVKTELGQCARQGQPKDYYYALLDLQKNGTKDAHEFYAVISNGKTGNGK